jgi:hypothetical protein
MRIDCLVVRKKSDFDLTTSTLKELTGITGESPSPAQRASDFHREISKVGGPYSSAFQSVAPPQREI